MARKPAPKYMRRKLRKSRTAKLWRKADIFSRNALKWLPVWSSPLLAMATLVSFFTYDPLLMIACFTAFLCAIAGSVLLVRHEQLAREERILKYAAVARDRARATEEARGRIAS